MTQDWSDLLQWEELRHYLLNLLRELPDWGLLALLLALVAFGALLLWRVLRVLSWLRMWRYRTIGSRGERKAEELLTRAGYEVLDRQVTRRYPVLVDGTAREVLVRADMLVRKSGRTYVAEVKAGWIASNPLHTPTRRQLLEYEVVFDVRGVLMVDVPRKRVLRVEFPIGD